MQTITGVKCIYDVKGQGWLIALALDGAEEELRFPIPGPEHVETFLDAYEDSLAAGFDPAANEVVFTFSAVIEEIEDDEDEDLDDDEDDEDDEDDDEGDDEASPAQRRGLT